MNDLFTVNWALTYQDWEYDRNVADYNYYTVDEFAIRVNRVDYYLLLYIYNGCDELVFSGHIKTQEEYLRLIKKNLKSWRCRTSGSSIIPTPPAQGLVLTPLTVNVTYLASDVTVNLPVPVVSILNEACTLISTFTVSGLNITLNSSNIFIGGIAYVSDIGFYSVPLNFQGTTTGTIQTVTFNITINSNPAVTNYITQETGSAGNNKIATENGSNFLIRE